MITEVFLSDEVIASQLQAVLQAGYASEAAIIAHPDFPPLRESLADLRRSSDQFLVFRKGGKVVGVVSFFCDAGCIRTTRLVVHPDYHRQGIASALLAELERRFESATSFAVSTAKDNLPAIRLYEQFGYVPNSTTHSAEGILLVHLTKRRSAR